LQSQPQSAAPAAGSRPRRELAVLLLSGAALFTANAQKLSLPALDDCFYARKALEMERTGHVFTVTWADRPAFQNPPLQIWLTARSFALFGENDFAARLPSMLMALGTLAGTYRIAQLTVGPAAGVGAGALLLLSPTFVNHARRCMLEMPLTLWVLLAVLVLIEGLRDPRRHALFALPLAAGILTKSVLGLLPLGILVAGAAACPPLRAALRRGWIWLGILGGLALGASWTVHQYVVFGPEALRVHYLDEVVSRSTQPLDVRQLLLGYPLALLASYQPVILPAVLGAAALFRRWREEPGDPSCLLPIWAALPTVVYSLSSARSPRYLFPVFPALALCASHWVTRRFPRFAVALRTAVAPAAAVVVAAIFWVRPALLVAAGTAFFKEDRVIRSRVPEGEPITYLGSRADYWALANPLLYYTGRRLEAPRDSAAEALRAAAERRSGLVLVQRSRQGELPATGYTVVLERPEWALVQPHFDPGRSSD
jgi:4-amino-4-deoxy-L-arabinose transferase-like glycosyltransferase